MVSAVTGHRLHDLVVIDHMMILVDQFAIDHAQLTLCSGCKSDKTVTSS